jgi:hypothetical protein
MPRDLPALPSIPLGRYRHHKGGEYEVLGVVRHSESLEPLVLYRPIHTDSGAWVRPFAMFLEPVEQGGRTQPRFSRVPADAAPVGGATEAELAATVTRMEAALSTSRSPAVQHLMGQYRTLAARFERDLASSARDISLAKAGALMLVQAAARADSAPRPANEPDPPGDPHADRTDP